MLQKVGSLSQFWGQFNLFQANTTMLYPLEIPENQDISLDFL